jgi:hypothetical protein
MTGEKGRGWSGQDSQDRKVRTGKPEHEKHGQGSWDCMTAARIGHPGQENQDSSVWTGQHDRSPWTGQRGQVNSYKDRITGTGKGRAGQL